MPAHLGPPWADLVFHVLAHVPLPFPSSLHDPLYVAFAERHLGPASGRSLGEDAVLLGKILSTHELCAHAQWVAFLFEDAAMARAVTARDLREMDDVHAHGPALRALVGIEPVAESLRAAAELEAPHHARLPSTSVNAVELDAALVRARAAAPRLASLGVRCSRALARRGRAVPSWIYVGVPGGELGVTAAHVATQAAHEATVVEVGEAAIAGRVHLAERDVEHAALVVLSERALGSLFAADHERWWNALGLPAVSEVRAKLSNEAMRLVAAL
jgi:hypothetical protein